MPSQRIQWLGFAFDSLNNLFVIIVDKMSKIQKIVVDVLKAEFVTAKIVVSVVGNVTALYLALGGIVYLLTKQIQMCISQAQTCQINISW